MAVPMPAPPKLPKITPIIAVMAISLMAGAYLLFLYATWNQFQNDRASRDRKIDELLDRLPKAEGVNNTDD